jgi:ribose-phosphate pyrophosphokinase
MSHMLVDNGIEEIDVACTHGVFVRDALQKLTAVPQIKDIYTTDTVYIPPEKRIPQLHILSVASIFGEAIRRNYERKSIQGLFVFGDE